MLRSMSTAISGMRNHQTSMDVVAANIANVNTPGYKASRVNFKEALYQSYNSGSAGGADTGGTNPTQIGLGMDLGGITSIMTQGTVISTGKNTDVMIQGEGFFVLGTIVGGVANPSYFTRDGSFAVDHQGYLVEPSSGYYVFDAEGDDPIQIQPDWASFNIGSDGRLTGVRSDGTVDNVNQPQIGLAIFPNPEGLVRKGGNLYQEGNNSGPATIGAPNTNGRGTLVSASLEASNVDLAEQFSRMIMAQRGFQANSRIINASDEMLQELNNLKR
ncbi:MAG: flagellar hook-basal body complex protein [Chloroflexota bacterium]|jgi:flagellar hook protein FlgE